jgi:hypothetical protein
MGWPRFGPKPQWLNGEITNCLRHLNYQHQPGLYINILFVPRSKHIPSRLHKPVSNVQGSNRCLVRGTYKTHINNLYGQNVEFLNLTSGIKSNHYALQGRKTYFPLGYKQPPFRFVFTSVRLRQTYGIGNSVCYIPFDVVSVLSEHYVNTPITTYGFPVMSQRVHLETNFVPYMKHLTSKHQYELRTSVPTQNQHCFSNLTFTFTSLGQHGPLLAQIFHDADADTNTK